MAVKIDPEEIKALAEALTNQAQQESVATVRYAGNLTDAVRLDIEKGIHTTFQEVEGIHFVEEMALVAGFRVEFRDFIYDATLTRRLHQNN